MCEYEDCGNPAEFVDANWSVICQDCMVDAINEEGADPEDFSRFRMVV